MSVCLSARMDQEPYGELHQFSLPVAVVRSSFNGVAMRYVLPVLRMTQLHGASYVFLSGNNCAPAETSLLHRFCSQILPNNDDH